jgi:hypothetical protein
MDFATVGPWKDLVRLWAGDGFRFRFNLRPGRAGWLEKGLVDEAVLEERRRWLEGAGPQAVFWGEGADAAWVGLAPMLGAGLQELVVEGGTAETQARRVAMHWAPDFLLLRRMGPGEPLRWVGGAVCAASGWDPDEKLGKTVMEIHAPVPGLNEGLGARVDRFLDGLKPGEIWERENWGLAASGDLNLHPALGRTRVSEVGRMEDLWFRLEEQAFVALPGGAGLLFLIHVRNWPLAEVLEVAGDRDGFGRMLRSMSLEIAEYKGLGAARCWT